MDSATILALGGAGIAVGFAIGATGIGGVLLVPLLAEGLGLPVPGAIAIALWSYLWSGLLAVLLYGRRGSIPWPAALWLCAGAMPGAWLGARAIGRVPDSVLKGLIAALLLGAGLYAWRPMTAPAPRRLGAVAWALLGGGTGFLAALLGAGGAVLLVPILLALGQPALPAIGLGQAIQLPIAGVASLANLAAGRIDLALGSIVAVALALGIAAGVPLAHRLPQTQLRRLLGALMALLGAAMLVRLALALA